MVRITVDDLRRQTDEWVRRAATETVVITDGGTEIARLEAQPPPPPRSRFADRLLLPEFARFYDEVTEGDSTQYISEDRDRELL